MPRAGVLPMLRHELPDEEGGTVRAHASRCERRTTSRSGGTPTPRTSTSCTCSAASPASLVRRPAPRPAPTLDRPAGVQARRRRPGVAPRPRDGRPLIAPPPRCRVLGICGGCHAARHIPIADPDGIEGAGRRRASACWGSRPCSGREGQQHRVDVTFAICLDPRGPANGSPPRTTRSATARTAGRFRSRDPCGRRAGCWPRASTGCSRTPAIVARLTGRRPPPVLEETFDLLADAVDAHLDTSLLDHLTRGSAASASFSAGRPRPARCEEAVGADGSGSWPCSARRSWVRRPCRHRPSRRPPSGPRRAGRSGADGDRGVADVGPGCRWDCGHGERDRVRAG